MKNMRLLLAFLILAACAFAQQGKPHEYRIVYDSTLSSTARVLTVHLPASSSKNVLFKTGTVYSEQACSFTVERDGSTPSGSPTQPVKLNPRGAWVSAPIAQVFAASDSTGGTDVGGAPFFVSAGQEYRLDLSPQVLEAGAALAQNLTFRTASCSGRIIIRIFDEERVRWP